MDDPMNPAASRNVHQHFCRPWGNGITKIHSRRYQVVVEHNYGNLPEVGGKPKVERILGSNPKVTTNDGGKFIELNPVWFHDQVFAHLSLSHNIVSFLLLLDINSYRYLWPLIHYHKFLARCIKKLKRNGIDVKNSVSPVSVFLREEVCSVSDHLAAVSLFDSDQWMECLKDFHGWTDPREEAEEIVRNLISQLKLRPMNEPGDVDSPLLRNQIDEQYLRAMASARAQMAGAVSQGDKRSSRETPSSGKRGPSPRENKSKISRGYDATSGHPPAYPRHASPGFVQQNQGNGMPHSSGRRSRFGYPPQAGGQWYGQQNWNPNGQFPYGEDVSVHSGISGDNFAHQYDPNYHGGMPPQYYNPMMYPQHPMPTWPLQTGFDPSLQDPSLMEPYVAEQGPPPGWYSHPHSSGMFPSQPSEMGGMVPGTPGGPLASHDMSAASGMDPSQQIGGDHTPYKYNPSQVPMSPYWGHLDHGTLAMMGIASPHAPSAPQTPARSSTRGTGSFDGSQDASAISAQPLLLRQQYAGYGVSNRFVRRIF